MSGMSSQQSLAPCTMTFARLYPAAISGKVNFNLVAMEHLHPMPTALLLVPPLSPRFPHIALPRTTLGWFGLFMIVSHTWRFNSCAFHFHFLFLLFRWCRKISLKLLQLAGPLPLLSTSTV